METAALPAQSFGNLLRSQREDQGQTEQRKAVTKQFKTAKHIPNALIQGSLEKY